MSAWREITGDIKKIAFTPPGLTAFDAVICPGNRMIHQNGRLTMGAGIAKVFRDWFPNLDLAWGRRLQEVPPEIQVIAGYFGRSPTFWVPVYFQTKGDWRRPATVDLVKASTEQLAALIWTVDWHNVLLPRPGCGNGGLSWSEQVFPILEPYLVDLGERITVISQE